jgi:hypothetical protein
MNGRGPAARRKMEEGKKSSQKISFSTLIRLYGCKSGI